VAVADQEDVRTVAIYVEVAVVLADSKQELSHV
jgi:hypothetical protein